MQKCSPEAVLNQPRSLRGKTCLSPTTLETLASLWNARHPDDQIPSGLPPDTMLVELRKRLSRTCKQESCWIKNHPQLKGELKTAFAPVSPAEWRRNPEEWLSSTDILDVMHQYEKAYKCFEFIGPSPIDFDAKMAYGACVWEELCTFSLSDMLKKGKRKIGIIFNTDPHDKGGSHWISLFIDIRRKTIFFFDSVGRAAPAQVQAFVKRVQEQGHGANPRIDLTFDQNHPVEHQYGNSACGVYSLFFIVHMLEDKFTGGYLKTHVLPDAYIQKFRKVYFNEDPL